MMWKKRPPAAPNPQPGWMQLAPGVQVSADDTGLAFLDPATGRIFVANGTARSLWLSAAKGLSIPETAQEIATDFGIARDLAERDIRTFVAGLEQNGLTVREAKS